jgi:murein DD-endopeptidase MepM/ murein hydrolase activator NlpD
MSAMAPVSARITAIEQRLAAFGLGGTQPAASSASLPTTAGVSFATAMAEATAATPATPTTADTAGTAAPPTAPGATGAGGAGGAGAPEVGAPEVGLPATAQAGGAVSSAWTIPWLAGTAPLPTDAASASRATPGASATGTIRAAATATTAGGPLAAVEPLSGRLTQDFGPTTSKYSAPMTVNGVHYAHFHDGIDIAAPLGRPVRSMAAGEVEFAGEYSDGAVVVRVRHADGSLAVYGHLGAGLDVKAGDKVAAGEQLGVVGMTGRTTGPHLHLELTVGGTPVDPLTTIRSGRLPGATDGSIDTSVLPTGAPDAVTSAALARFDRVAKDIPYAAEIRAAAVKAGLDPLLLASLVKAESGFRATAVSSAGAMGLTQLMPATAKSAHVSDPFDAAQNLRAGANYFATNLRIYGRVDLALAAYQAGKGAVARAGGIPDSPTTHRYIDRILTSWSGYLEAAA